MRTILIAALLLAGCGKAAEHTNTASIPNSATTTSATSNWDTNLLTLIPQIDKCIAISPTTRRVTYAGPDAAGATIVRMTGPDGSVDCRFDHNVAIATPRDEALTIAGDGAAIFVRGPGENPGGECFAAPEVHAADGTLLGWMDDPEGC